ncbi:MAG: adenylate/guanylate cyclase, partial [Meiothermus sp.]
ALCALATGFRARYEGLPARSYLRQAALLARKVHHPTLYFYALIALGQELEAQAPQKALALSQYLLSQTAGRGFEVGHGYARLLRAQTLMSQGREAASLLEFTPITPLAKTWRAALQGNTVSDDPSASAQTLNGYGILGVWARWLSRSTGANIKAERSPSEKDIKQ